VASEDRDGEDDTTWKHWQTELDVFVACQDFTWIRKSAARSGRQGQSHISHEVSNHNEAIMESNEEGETL
jgi:hypothetical protein